MRCRVCNGITNRFIDENTDILYYNCPDCNCIFKSPNHYQSLNKQKLRYDLHENDPDDAGYQAYFQRFLDFVLPHASHVRTALDFGCGRSTLLADMLGENHIECDYYDPIYYPEYMDHSKKYDMIVSTEVFEHLHHPGDLFSLLAKRLLPHGIIAIQTQFHPNDNEAFKSWYYHKDPTHIVFFTVETFKKLAALHGFILIAENGKNIVILQKGRS